MSCIKKRGHSEIDDDEDKKRGHTQIYKNLRGQTQNPREGNRRMESVVPHLPYEIVDEIFSRLPLKSLLRFSSVCKEWRSWVMDHEVEERVFYGNDLLELYSVVINEIKGDHIKGKITVERCVICDPSTVVIYNGDEGEKKNIGEPLLLTAECEPFLFYDPMPFWFDIGPKGLEHWLDVWSPGGTPYDSVETREIVEDGWGKVTFKFQFFSDAVDAHVDVKFLGRSIDDRKKKYPTHVYGEIYATCYGMIDTKIVLIRRNSREEAEPVENGQPIQLSRSVIAAQIRSHIHIHVDLWGCYDDDDIAIHTSFVAGFRVRPYPCTSAKEPHGFESPVQVNVTWMEHGFPPLASYRRGA